QRTGDACKNSREDGLCRANRPTIVRKPVQRYTSWAQRRKISPRFISSTSVAGAAINCWNTTCSTGGIPRKRGETTMLKSPHYQHKKGGRRSQHIGRRRVTENSRLSRTRPCVPDA